MDGYDLLAFGTQMIENMCKIRPNAVWVLQAWGENPRKPMLQNIPNAHILILNQLAGRSNLTRMSDGFYGKPWLWCPIHNYGGRNGLFGFLRTLGREPFELRTHHLGRSLQGIGLSPEALETNPAFYELMGGLAFETKPLITSDWVANYSIRRYGKQLPKAIEAWKLLEDSVYNSFMPQPGGAESFFCARPATSLQSVSTWGPKVIDYDIRFAEKASALLFDCYDSLSDSEGYLYDLVDVTRQALANWSRVQYQTIMYLLSQKNLEGVRRETSLFLDAILAQDRLLSTRSEFLLGNWIKQASDCGEPYGMQNNFVQAAKMLITTWGHKEASQSLHDYSAREWAGITRTLYFQRWQEFFNLILNNAETFKDDTVAKDWQDDSISTVKKDIDWYALEIAWVNNQNDYSTTPSGDLKTEVDYILTHFLDFARE